MSTIEKTSLRDRLQHAWNAFRRPVDPRFDFQYGSWSSIRPDKTRLSGKTEKSIIASVYNRMAIDISTNNIRHVRLDDDERYIETIKSGLNYCFETSANLDQPPKSFIHDVALSLFDEGVVALVPVDTTFDPLISDSYDVKNLRVGKILEWYPKHIKMRVYNENDGLKHDIIMPKSAVAIIENPLASVMNDQNSMGQRLIRKLNQLDAIDEQSASGKLDIIMQLPYVIKSEAKQSEAEVRRKRMEEQLANSKYGIAYADATERITQLNRPAENNLMTQVDYLTKMLFTQLGITEGVLSGTASEEEMRNYLSRTIAPVLNAICEEVHRKFLTRTARTQGQAIKWFNDPFMLASTEKLAELADKFTRNEILSSNEFRQIIGFKPVDDPRADELRNKNLNASNDQLPDQLPNEEDTLKNELDSFRESRFKMGEKRSS